MIDRKIPSCAQFPHRYTGPALVLTLFAVTGCQEDSPTGPESPSHAQAAPEAATPSVVAASFAHVSSDGFTSCAVASDRRAWCWGDSNAGELGDGTTQPHLVPRPVAGDLRFRLVANNSHRACGITTDNRAYCWGAETVGDGTTAQRLTPTAVAGNLRFFQLDVGTLQICGVSNPDRRAYCWGTPDALTPKLVPGGLRFRMVSGGEEHFCGVTTTKQAWCWGSNRFGQIGDGVLNTRVRLEPSRVAGDRAWRHIDAGFQHTCAVTTAGKAFCWGHGRLGHIGDGNTLNRFEPRAVRGRIQFDRVSAGGGQTCGEASGGETYCWGSNQFGGLGDGTKTMRLRPVLVRGGHDFVQVSAGGWHACGVTRDSDLYCWGRGGQVGDGAGVDRTRPTLIASGP